MRSFLLFLASAAAAGGMLACGRDTVISDGSSMGGAGGMTPTTAETIHFTPPQVLLLEPSEEAIVAVRVEPPGSYRVDFALVSDSSEGFDAFLEDSSVTSSSNGTAIAVLHAPSSASAFTVRASVGDVKALRAVSVSSEGFAQLSIEPSYDGARELGDWIASARPGSTCQEIEDPWEDGPLKASGPGELVIDAIPAGLSVSVSLRQQRAVGGCTTLQPLKAEAQVAVAVEAVDRPLQLEDTSLELAFDIDSTSTQFSDRLTQATNAAVNAFVQSTVNDGQLIVEGMTRAIADSGSRDAFQAAAGAADFTSIVIGVLEDGSAVRKAARSLWLDAAASIPGPRALVGRLETQRTSSTFFLDTAGGIPASLNGFLGSAAWGLEREPGDVVVAGGPLKVSLRHWISAIAEATEAPQLALEESARCLDVAQALVAAAGEVHDGCGEACVEQLCSEALDEAWSLGREEGAQLSTFRLGLTGPVLVDGEARPQTLQGSWLGHFDEDQEATAAGAVSGKAH